MKILEKEIIRDNLFYKSIRQKYDFKIKRLAPKQMLQRLPIALAQVKTGNTSNRLLSKTVYFLYQSREIT